MYVLGVSLPSHESEQSCIYVLGVSLPSQESEQSCVCVRVYRYQARRVSSHVFMC